MKEDVEELEDLEEEEIPEVEGVSGKVEMEEAAGPGEITEGKAKIIIDEKVFYNPKMEFSRDISSLAVSALGPIRVCDSMSATGVRGIRYAIENPNVESILFLDMEEAAVKNTQANMDGNDLKGEIVKDELNHFLYTSGKHFNFIEVDPFGSPVPFIRSALLNMRSEKTGYLSVTATDTAVLCGAHAKACRIYYGSTPLNNMFCHENGIRILLSYISRIASPLKLGIKPVLAISKNHYLKVMVKVEKGAAKALESVKKNGFLSYCPACFDVNTTKGPFIEKSCKACGKQLLYTGPLWLDEIQNPEVLDKMFEENQKRNYKNKAELAKILSLMKGEVGMPPFYYNIHVVSDKFGAEVKSTDEVIRKIREKGFRVTKTHFDVLSIKTDAPTEEVVDSITK